LIPTGTKERAEEIINEVTTSLGRALEATDMAQNIDKLVVLPKLRSLRENRQSMMKKQSYAVKRSHRHLGTQYSATSCNHIEITMRIRAANRGWQELQGLLFDEHITLKTKRLFFVVAVQAAALSGLNALCLAKEDSKRLVTCLLKK
jgi:hypothetical protein